MSDFWHSVRSLYHRNQDGHLEIRHNCPVIRFVAGRICDACDYVAENNTSVTKKSWYRACPTPNSSSPTTSCHLSHKPRLCPPPSSENLISVCTFGTGAGLPSEFKSALDNLITSHKIVVFMKGTKQFPQCGFSHTVVQVSSMSSYGTRT